MNYSDVMSQLKKMGTAQNVKIYRRHGETSCKTPDAATYIEKALARVKKRK
jgi:hypothetical protein